MKKPFSMSIEGFAVIDKEVKASGNSGRVYLPPKWIGKKVKVVLLEPLE